MDYERNMHSGHRSRLFETAERVGIENLDKIQSLEAILCLVFPRGDVNPIAHRILDKYKDISIAVRAPIQDLMQIKGMGRKSAIKFRTIYGICKVINEEKIKAKRKVGNYEEICDFVEDVFRYEDEEVCFALGIGANNDLIGHRPIAYGSVNMVNIDLPSVSGFVSSMTPSKAILMHNHPNGYCSPSAQDEVAYEKLLNLFEFSGCQLMDSVIIGSDGIYSLEYKKVMRDFVRKPSKDENYYQFGDKIEQILKDINK